MPFKLDPEYNAILKSLFGNKPTPAPLPAGDVESRRDRMEPGIAVLADPNFPLDQVVTRDFFADTSDGQKILLRWYSSNHKSPSPAVIYAHGGGMILGSVKVYDKVVAAYVARTGVPFLAVDYRRAPEHPHPIPVNDVYAALNWLVAHSQELGVDSSRIGIMGDSAGGSLAVAAALLTRQNDGPRLAKLILLSPMLDDRTVSADEHLTPFLSWNTTDNETGWQALLGCSKGGDMVTETAAPARMVVATGMPPLYIEVGELDLFRNESISSLRPSSTNPV
ncbi:lipase esterase [Fusarium circinatum]|uniref:Lipase esterase n=1 Tax=Fusarium circinatum TaxID=48490 RepID=A0A8H5TX70_FUSCI|nr:lipase esterase [Fusarium circinatum]